VSTKRLRFFKRRAEVFSAVRALLATRLERLVGLSGRRVQFDDAELVSDWTVNPLSSLGSFHSFLAWAFIAAYVFSRELAHYQSAGHRYRALTTLVPRSVA
jgi:hypothetical protein